MAFAFLKVWWKVTLPFIFWINYYRVSNCSTPILQMERSQSTWAFNLIPKSQFTNINFADAKEFFIMYI